MVGATPAAAAAIVNGCCTLMATNPTQVLQLTSPVNFKNQKAEKVARDSQTDG
jgi:hypothetical protein